MPNIMISTRLEMHTMGNSKAMRNMSIELGRIFAFWAVILYHFLYHFSNVFSLTEPLFVFSVGKLGIAFFFFITGNFLRLAYVDNQNFLKFTSHRVIVLLIPYWITVVIAHMLITFIGLPGREVGNPDFIVNLLVCPEVFNANFVDGAYWYISRIFYFYLLLVTFKKCKLGQQGVCVCLGILSVIHGIIQLTGTDFGVWEKPLRFFLLDNAIPYLFLGWSLFNRSDSIHRKVLYYLIGMVGLGANFKVIAVVSLICVIFDVLSKYPIEICSRSRFIKLHLAILYPAYLLHQNLSYSISIWMNYQFGFPFVIGLFSCLFLFVFPLSFYIHQLSNYILLRVSMRTNRA